MYKITITSDLSKKFKFPIIKTIRSELGLSLDDAKNIVDSPSPVFVDTIPDKQIAYGFKDKMAQLGVEVEINKVE